MRARGRGVGVPFSWRACIDNSIISIISMVHAYVRVRTCGCVQDDVTPVKWRSFCARRNQESNGGSVLL